MSDLGLDADLQLDIRQALEQAARLEAAFERATNRVQVTVTADTSTLPSEIAGAIDSADTNVHVTGEADALTGDVTSAIDAADTTATVVGDASDLTDEVTSAVDAADTEAIITGDASGVSQAIIDAVERAAQSTGRSGQTAGGAFARGFTSQVTKAVQALPEFDVKADITPAQRAIQGIRSELAQLSTRQVGVDIDATEATRRVNALRAQLDRLGSETTEPDVRVDIGAASAALSGFQQSLNRVDSQNVSVDVDASGSINQATDDALELSSALVASSRRGLELRTILQLGGVGAAAAGIQQLVGAASELEQAIGGTTAIFGPAERQVVSFARGAAESAGLTEASARSLTSQIGGLLQGFDFTQAESAEMSVTLAQLGADLSATFGGTTQEAVEALGAAIRGETDPIERFGVSVSATRADLKAVELGLAASTAEVDANARAQGILALIMEQSANAQGQFAREVDTTAGQLERAKAEFGNTAAAIGETLQPAANDLIALVRAEIIPAIGDLGRELGPNLARLVLALAPAFGTLTNLLIALSPIVSALATVLGSIPAPILQAIATFLLFRSAAGGIGSVLSTVGNALAPFVVRTNAVAGAMNVAGGSATTLRSQLGSMAGGAVASTIALAGMTAVFIGISGAQQRAAQDAADLERQQQGLQDALAGTGDEAGSVNAAFETFAETGFKIDTEFGNIDLSAESLNSSLAEMGLTTRELADAARDGDAGVDGLLQRLEATRDITEEDAAVLRSMVEEVNRAARATIDAGLAQEDYTQAQVDAALAATRNADGTRNYSGALEQLNEVAARNVEQQNALAQATGGVDAEGASHNVTALGITLEALQSRTGNAERKFVDFALAADAAGLSGAELDAVAAELGVDSEALAGSIDGVAGPIRELAEAAAGGVPALADIAGEIDAFTVTGFRDRLRDAVQAVVEFQDNLAAISETGNDRVAAIAAQLGPQYAGVIAEALRNGNTEIIGELEILAAALEAEGVDLNELITGEIGPNLVTGTGQVGTQMTDAFGASFNPETEVRPSIRAVEGAVEDETPAVSSATQNLGEAGREGFAQGFHPEQAAAGSIRAIEGTVEANRPNILQTILGLGQSGTAGFAQGFHPEVAASGSIRAIEGTVEANRPNILQTILGLGQSGTTGFQQGFHPELAAHGSIRAIEGTVEDNRPAVHESGRQLGSSGHRGFAAGFHPEFTAHSSIRAVEGTVESRRPTILESLLGLGRSGTSGFRSGLSPMPGVAASQTDASRARVAIGGPAFEAAAIGTGRRAVIGLRGGMADMPSTARNVVNQAVGAARGAGAGAYSAGYSIGANLSKGVAQGVQAAADSAAAAAREMVLRAVASARQAAKIGSPSRLFAEEVGAPIAQGVAVGIDEDTQAATDAIAALVASVAEVAIPDVAPGVGLAATALPTTGSLNGAALGGTTIAITVQGVPGMVQITATGPDAEANGRAGAKRFLDGIASQGLHATARVTGPR